MKNTASNYWKHYNNDYPLNVMVIGKTTGAVNYYVNRSKSRIIALEYLKSGSQTLIINSKKYNVSKNSTILLTKNSSHEYYCDDNNEFEKRWIVFDGELAEYFIKTYIPENEYCFEQCNLLHYFDEIYRIKNNYCNDYEKMIDNISVILHKMFIHIKNSVKKSNSKLPEQIQKFLDDNVENKITIDDLCTYFSYSKNQIINIFKSAYGVTPYRYFLERKIDIAKLYLCNTKYSVSEISQLLAFNDQNYFSAQFRRLTGTSPLEYRKNMNSYTPPK